MSPGTSLALSRSTNSPSGPRRSVLTRRSSDHFHPNAVISDVGLPSYQYASGRFSRSKQSSRRGPTLLTLTRSTGLRVLVRNRDDVLARQLGQLRLPLELKDLRQQHVLFPVDPLKPLP